MFIHWLFWPGRVFMKPKSKDPVPALLKSSVIYKLSCPGCLQQYIGKTDRSLAFRLREHAIRPEQPMYKHLSNCNTLMKYSQLVQIT